MKAYRERECLDCHHKWTSPVVFSEFTQNLSGEATKCCPACNSRTIAAGSQFVPVVCPDCGEVKVSPPFIYDHGTPISGECPMCGDRLYFADNGG